MSQAAIESTTVDELLSKRINLPQIKHLASWACGSHHNLCHLWHQAQAGHRLTSANALWVMTHLADKESVWLSSIRDPLIDMLLCETDTAKKRMLLQILRQQKYDAENIRTDFLDFCMSKINSEHEPYAIRSFCIRIACKMCMHYPELAAELGVHLEMLKCQPLSPGLQCTLRHTTEALKINKLSQPTD